MLTIVNVLFGALVLFGGILLYGKHIAEKRDQATPSA
jgi:hypothetical protein